MYRYIWIALILALAGGIHGYAQDHSKLSERIATTLDSSHAPELVLIQEFTVAAPVKEVWKAMTTKEGWESWAVPVAEVELTVNGTIKTVYDPNGKIGDSSTITTHILNYVPFKLLTLQAEMTDNFPGFMKQDERDFYNIIILDSLDLKNTHLTSYGIGYKNTPDYLSLMNYFINANTATYANLIDYLENEK